MSDSLCRPRDSRACPTNAHSPSGRLPAVARQAGLLVIVCMALAGCAGVSEATHNFATRITPYQIDVVQGNFVSSEQVALLKAGQDRRTVRDILGTPLLQSVFHADRWDYVFTFKRKGEEPQLRKVTVFFKGDLLERFEADAVPTEAEFVATLDSGRKSRKVPELEASEERLKEFPVANKAPEEPKPLPPLPASYPPLEPSAP